MKINIFFCLFLIPIYSAIVLASDGLTPAIGVKKDTKEFTYWQQQYLEKKSQLIALQAIKSNSKQTYFINGLISEQSPYLLRHSTNPINWQTWSNDVFDQAKKQGKLIFLSIGYSSCHWCHVMEKQSFTDVGIAKLLSTNYLAIKVDRELSPHIDEHYQQLLQALNGSAGWPITAILNSDAAPIYISAFIDKDKLSQLLKNSFQLWQSHPTALNASADNLVALAKKNHTLGEQKKLTTQALQHAIDNRLQYLKQHADNNFGGLSGQVKFPNEAALLLQLNYLARHHDPDLEKSLRLQLDNMISHGLYDMINGGFFRYSTERQWRVPHYEKMAYNQGLLLQVYSKAWQIFADEKYRQITEHLTNFITQWFYQENIGFFSAIDAEYKGTEGGYYLWNKNHLNSLLTPQEQQHIQQYSINDNYNSIFFKQPFAKENTHIITKLLKAKAQQLEKPIIDRKTIASWNAMIIVGLLNSYEISLDNNILITAENALQSIIKHQFDHDKQILFRSALNQKPIASYALLEDYSWLALAAIRLYVHTQNQQWLITTKALINAIYHHFTIQKGVPFSVSTLAQTGPIKFNSINLNDNETYSAYATLSTVLNALTKLSSKPIWRKRLQALNAGIISNYDHANGVNFSVAAAWQSIIEPSENIQYFANGNGRVEIKSMNKCNNNWQNIAITLNSNWHINSNSPFDDNLIPTQLNLQDLNHQNYSFSKIKYPEAKLKNLPFSNEKLSLFSGDFAISFKQKSDNTHKRKILKLNLQACTDSFCKLPETLFFNINQCN